MHERMYSQQGILVSKSKSCSSRRSAPQGIEKEQVFHSTPDQRLKASKMSL